VKARRKLVFTACCLLAAAYFLEQCLGKDLEGFGGDGFEGDVHVHEDIAVGGGDFFAGDGGGGVGEEVFVFDGDAVGGFEGGAEVRARRARGRSARSRMGPPIEFSIL